MADPQGGTFIDIPKLLIDADFMKAKLKYVTDQNVLDFWTKEWPNSQRSNESGEVTSWVVSKFGAFLSNEMMRNIIGQTKSSFDLREIMDNKKILLVNLSKGKTGDLNSKLMGMIFVMKFQAAAMSRANVPENERPDFCLYVDEFQNFSTDSFATIMSEARKYHLNLIVANQFTTQLSEEIRDAVFGNMGTIVSYRIGQNDVEAMSRYFQPLFEGDDLLRIPSFNAVVRTLIGGVPTQPFSMAGLPPLGTPNQNLGQALRQLSAAKYGRPKAQVEKEIFARLATKPSVARSPNNSSFGPAGQVKTGSGQAVKAPVPGTGSFLDEWLAKRKSPAPPVSRPAQPASIAQNSPSQVYTPPSTQMSPVAPIQPLQNTFSSQQLQQQPQSMATSQAPAQQSPALPLEPYMPPVNNTSDGVVNLSQTTPQTQQENTVILNNRE
jgi:hypothetical protein